LIDAAFSGNVSQHVYPAVDLIQLTEHRPNLVAIGYVALHGFGSATHGLDQLGGILHSDRVNVGQQQIGARFGKSYGHRPAHARGRA